MSKNKNNEMTHTKKPFPSSGESDIQEERIIVFIWAKPKNNEMNHTKSISRFMETKGKHVSFKLSPDDGKQANHFSRSGATL